MSDLKDLLNKPMSDNANAFWLRLNQRLDAIEQRLPDKLKGQSGRFIAVAKSHIDNLPPYVRSKVMACTAGSIESVIMQAAEFGFALDGKHCYIVPYGTEAKFMPSYIGMIAVARRVGTITDCRSFLVMPSDEFDHQDVNGDVTYRFRQDLNQPRVYDKCLGVLTVIDHRGGRRIAWMCKADIEKRRKVSKATGKDTPWQVWPEEQACKTGSRHELKTFSDDPAMIALFAADDAHNDLERLMSRPVNDGAFERLRASLSQPGDDIAKDAAEHITDQTLFDRDADFQAAAELEQQKEMAARQ